jgi:dsDNA-specific endonuclease/ATPase MutS2
MWISKKKLNQMMAEAVEKEREREQMYRLMDEMFTRVNRLEHQVEQNTNDIQNNRHYIPTPSKKQLNG